MASRMEKYYNQDAQVTKRSERNQDLYKEIYDFSEYSNIEAVATLDRTNEIDISKIKNMLKNREDYKRQKEYRSILRQDDEEKEEKKELVKEEIKTYDIKEELEKLKQEKKEDDAYRSLGNTNYNILKELKVKNEHKKELSESEDKELKNMINTITSTSLLNKLDNEELSLNMFEDLASSGETTTLAESGIEALLKEAKEIDMQKEEEEKAPTLDTSFFTSSMKFGKEDFENPNAPENKAPLTSFKIKIVVGIILAVISCMIIFLIYKFIG